MTIKPYRDLSVVLALILTAGAVAACGDDGPAPCPEDAPITLAHDTLTISTGHSAYVGFADCNGEPTGAPAVYLNSNPALATITTAGQFSAVAAGTTRVIVTDGVRTDTAWVRISGAYAFILDTTIGGGVRYYTTATSPQGVAFLTRPSHARLARFDLLTRALNVDASVVGDQAHGVAVDPAGTFAYVANQDGPTLNRVNTATNGAEAPIGMAMHPFQVVVSASASAVVVSGDDDSLQITNLAGTPLRRVGVAAMPIGLARRSNGEVIVTHLGSTELRRVNAGLTSSTLIRNLPSTGNGIALNPAGSVAYIASTDGDALYVVNVATGDSVTTIALPDPWGVAVTPDGARVLVTTLGGFVYSLKPGSAWARDSIDVGGTPRGISVQSNGWGIIVANEDGNLHVIR